MSGPIRVSVDIKLVRDILIKKEGFRKTRLQFKKKGQVFGVIKPVGNILEIHVRGYKDNTLDAELEISRKYIQHLFKGAVPFDLILINILRKHNIPFEIIKPINLSIPKIDIPKFLINWKKATIALIASIFAFKILSLYSFIIYLFSSISLSYIPYR